MALAKTEERNRARTLRALGLSIGDIARDVGCSEGSVHSWVHDVALTEEQKSNIYLRTRNHQRASSGAHKARLRRWEAFHRAAEVEWGTLRFDPAFMFGLALYVGEGNKSDPNSAGMSNCDPRVILEMINFFVRIGVPKQDIVLLVHIHDAAIATSANEFWMTTTGFPAGQVRTPTIAVSRASKGARGNRQPYGTCHLFVYSTEVRQKIQRWMDIALQRD